MPEGDTIYKVAHFMAPRLEGMEIASTYVAGQSIRQLRACRVFRVLAQGKHLLIDCSTHQEAPPATRRGWVLRVHLGMHGSWHVYPFGSPYKKPKRQATVVITLVNQTQYVCFNAEDVALIEAENLSRKDAPLSRLGPDLLADTPDYDGMLRRARGASPQTQIIDVLLNQRIAAGLGNVYKSELMFLHALPMTTSLEHIDETLLMLLWRRGSQLLRQNLGRWRRTTTCNRSQIASEKQLGRPRLWVYGRDGAPCLVCQTPLCKARLGRHLRDTFWCPRCQNSLQPLDHHKQGLKPAIVDAFKLA